MPHEILIYEEIGQWGVTPSKVIEQLRAADGADITVRINSGGGDAFDGFAIYQLLKAYPGTSTAVIDGIAASSASVIAMGCDRVEIVASGFLMIHEATGGGYGSSEDLQRKAMLIDAINANMANLYSQRSGMALEDVVSAMAAETWYTAEQAVANGFADAIVENMAMAAKAPSLAKFEYRHVPKAISKGKDMDLQNIALAAGLRPDATMSDVHAHLVEAKARHDKVVAELQAQNAKILALELEKTQIAGAAILGKLRDSGRLAPGSRFEAMALEYHNTGDVPALEALASALEEMPMTVPVSGRQSVDDNRPAGSANAAPRTATGDVDYALMSTKLSPEQQAQWAPLARDSSWKTVFSQPSSDFLWTAAGYERVK
jgi:ATP-dependent protease ClpP protease subunit